MFFKNFFGNREINKKINLLSALEFKKALQKKGIQLIDVRTPNEFALCKIKGAQNLNFLDRSGFEKGVEKLNKQAAIYLYCHSGARSKRASKVLIKMGFCEVFDLQGGYSNWS